jgi:uncharacterized protein (TIGR00297 family)
MTSDIPAILVIGAGAAASVYWKKLTPAAALLGGVLCCAIYVGAGYTGLAMVAFFFLLGTAATTWRKQEKHFLPSQAAESGIRHSGQVLANGGVAAICGLFMVAWPAQKELFEIMMASALASATADTLSSELGIVFGKKSYNILSWKPDQRGMDGVVSLEGFLIGLVGAGFIACVYALGNAWSYRLLIITLAGVAGNLVDSVLGASLERRGMLNNDSVNFLNTLAGALVGLILGII